MFCGKCGAPIPDGGAFCSACGTPAARQVDPRLVPAAAPVTGESTPSKAQSTGTPEISPEESSIQPILSKPDQSKPPKSKVAGCIGAVVILGVIALCIFGGYSCLNKSAPSKPTLSDLQASAKDDADLILKRYGTPDSDTDNLSKHALFATRYLIYKKENVSFTLISKGDSLGEAPHWKLILIRDAKDTKSSTNLESYIITNRMQYRDVTR